MNKPCYGRNIDFSYVIGTDEYVSVFIPQTFPWEEEDEAEIILNDEFMIRANRQAKLLCRTDKGILRMFIPFERRDEKYICDLPAVLEGKGIRMEKAKGVCCDGTKWNQKDFTDKVFVCREGMLSLSKSPFWGNQFEFLFAEESIRPRFGGKEIKIMRFSYCSRNAWVRMENVFKTMAEGKTDWDISDFNSLLQYVGVWYDERPNRIRLFQKTSKETYDWVDISNLF